MKALAEVILISKGMLTSYSPEGGLSPRGLYLYSVAIYPSTNTQQQPRAKQERKIGAAQEQTRCPRHDHTSDKLMITALQHRLQNQTPYKNTKTNHIWWALSVKKTRLERFGSERINTLIETLRHINMMNPVAWSQLSWSYVSSQALCSERRTRPPMLHNHHLLGSSCPHGCYQCWLPCLCGLPQAYVM